MSNLELAKKWYLTFVNRCFLHQSTADFVIFRIAAVFICTADREEKVSEFRQILSEI